MRPAYWRLGHVVADLSMIEAHDLFEAHLTVSDLDRSIGFYRDVVGLRVAHVISDRGAAFLWIGAAGHAMLGLWTAGSAPLHISLHIAFRTNLAGVLAAPHELGSAGVTPLDFDGRPTDEPIVLAWMPAAAVYFRDPDGHLLEYIAMLPDLPRPELGIVPWRQWRSRSAAPAV
jgi:lactoylglutathione lyase